MKVTTPGCDAEQPSNPEYEPFQIVRRSPTDLQARFNELPQELREQADEILRAYTSWAAADAILRWRIGHLVLVITSDARRGDAAVGKISAALGCSRDKLYQCKRVAEAWPSGIEEFFPSDEEPHRLPITWSHLVELARMKDGRGELLEKTLAQGLTVGDLRKRVTLTNKKADTSGSLSSSDEADQQTATDTEPKTSDNERTTATTGSRVKRQPVPLGGLFERIRGWTDEQEQYLPQIQRMATKIGKDLGEEARKEALAEMDDLLRRKEKADTAFRHAFKEVRKALTKPMSGRETSRPAA